MEYSVAIGLEGLQELPNLSLALGAAQPRQGFDDEPVLQKEKDDQCSHAVQPRPSTGLEDQGKARYEDDPREEDQAGSAEALAAPSDQLSRLDDHDLVIDLSRSAA